MNSPHDNLSIITGEYMGAIRLPTILIHFVGLAMPRGVKFHPRIYRKIKFAKGRNPILVKRGWRNDQESRGDISDVPSRWVVLYSARLKAGAFSSYLNSVYLK